MHDGATSRPTVTAAAFAALDLAAKIHVARLPSNQAAMKETVAMCEPHARLSTYDDAQMAQLASAFFVLASRRRLHAA